MARDYSGYSISELQEALGTVDGDRYPENKAAIEAEIASRKASGEYDKHLAERQEVDVEHEKSAITFARKARVVVAWFLILSPVLLLNFLNFNATGPSAWIVITLTIAFAAYLIASHVAGIGLLKNKPWAHWVAIGLLAMQVLRLESETLYFEILSFVGVYFTTSSSGNIGFEISLAPGLTLLVGADLSFEIGINLLAMLMIYWLIKAREDIE